MQKGDDDDGIVMVVEPGWQHKIILLARHNLT